MGRLLVIGQQLIVAFESLIQLVRYLIENLLQVGGTHAISQVSVGRVGEEELPLCRHGSGDVLLPINVLLTPVHHPNVSCSERHTMRTELSMCVRI